MPLYLLTITDPPKSEGTGGLQFRTAAKITHREFTEDAGVEATHHVEPDGSIIDVTEIDTNQLYEITAGYLEAALWADCMPADPEIKQIQPDLFIVRDERDGETVHETLEEAQAEHQRRHDAQEFGGKEHLEPDDELRERARLDCALFMAMAGDDLESYVQACEDGTLYGAAMESYDPSEGTPLEWAGHDLWLTKRGHGTGFWDRGLGELGDRLTAAAERLGALVPEFYPYDKGDGSAGLS